MMPQARTQHSQVEILIVGRSGCALIEAALRCMAWHMASNAKDDASAEALTGFVAVGSS